MSDRIVSQIFPLKLKPQEQVLLLAMAHAADDDGVVRNLSDADLAWMLGDLGDRLYTIRQSLIKQGVIERVAGGDGVSPAVYGLRLCEAAQRKSAPLDRGMDGNARAAMIQEMGCTCQHCGDSGNQIFDAHGQVWRITKLQPGLGLSAENVTLLCAACAGREDVCLNQLPSAADYGLHWGQRHWIYPGTPMLAMAGGD
jgi:hypothetical protein